MLIANRYKMTGGKDAGGMGEVHEYLDTHLNRKVVLKTLKTGEEARRLVDEQKALLRVRSKHVVQLFDIMPVKNDQGKDVDALVLEYIDGKNLAPNSFKPDEEYLKTLWQISSGLADIHAADIIHRDIKPNNIRVDAEGVIKIFDFGLARKASVDDAKTNNVIGTLGYMAPELWASGKTISFDNKTDVYAFGVTALVLLGLKLPQQLVSHPPQKILAGTIRTLVSALPSDVSEIIEKCIAYSPEDRPIMKEVTNVLARVLLKDRHRAHLVINGKLHELSANKRTVNLSLKDVASIDIRYDGYSFFVESVAGFVTINNGNAAKGQVLPMCCVITFGASGSNRSFVTFDVSNPEVMP